MNRLNELEEIKNKIDIVEYIGAYVQLKQAGRNFKGNCPFHNEKTPSFIVSPEKQIWHCFGCNEGGDIFGFVMRVEGISFADALAELAEKTGVKIQKKSGLPKEATDKFYEINELACKYYEKELFRPENPKPLEYIKSRGLEEKTIREFRLGFAPAQGEVMVKELTQLGYNYDELYKAGIAADKNGRKIDQFRNRITFPITNTSGKVVGFSARVLDDALPKYINTPETAIYHKSNILFGFDKAKEAIRKQNHAIIVEGNMDMIFSFQGGVKNVVAASGTALTEQQLDLIKRFTKNIKLSFDIDTAGTTATRRAIDLAVEKGFNIKIITIPEGKDPADLVKSDPVKWVGACKNAKYMVDYLFDSTFEKYDIKNILDKKQAVRELLAVIKKIPDPVEKEHYLKLLGNIVEVSASALNESLTKIKTSKPISVQENEKEASQKINKKNFDNEEYVLALLLVLPQFADFFFGKLGAEEFNNEKISGIIQELKDLFVKKGEINIRSWLKKLVGEKANYINSLILYIEDLFQKSSEEEMGDEIINTVIRFKKRIIEKEKTKISRELKVSEGLGDRKKSQKLLKELQLLIEEEKNL